MLIRAAIPATTAHDGIGGRFGRIGASVTSTWPEIFDYLPAADAIDCEYLGWSSPDATQPFRDADMLDAAIHAAHVLGLRVCGYSYAGATDLGARMTSIARYWLVHNPLVYYQYMTADAHQSVDYFPELDVDMGAPLVPVLASRADLVNGGVYERRYAKGTALYNPGTAAASVPLSQPGYVLSATGAHSPKQGGTGAAVFQGPVSSVVLAPKRGVLVVRDPVVGR